MTTKNQDSGTERGIQANAIRHAQGVTITVEVPAEELAKLGREDRMGFNADVTIATLEALYRPKPGRFAVIRGGRA